MTEDTADRVVVGSRRQAGSTRLPGNHFSAVTVIPVRICEYVLVCLYVKSLICYLLPPVPPPASLSSLQPSPMRRFLFLGLGDGIPPGHLLYFSISVPTGIFILFLMVNHIPMS
jgi:hypothetical protein